MCTQEKKKKKNDLAGSHEEMRICRTLEKRSGSSEECVQG